MKSFLKIMLTAILLMNFTACEQKEESSVVKKSSSSADSVLTLEGSGN